MAKSVPSAIDLDPKEVLAHLNYLGYHHITGHQLKDFMKDLKKLIRYDQMKSKENSIPHGPVLSRYDQMNSKENSIPHGPVLSRYDQMNSKENSIPHGSVLSKQKKKSHQLANENRSSSLSSKSNQTKSSLACSSSNLDSQLPPLRLVQAKASSTTSISAPPTYIRPWNMRSSSQMHKAGTTSDPVALYQHYKELWKLQPLPGENNRSELRWKIREKLMACDPPPRLPLSSKRS